MMNTVADNGKAPAGGLNSRPGLIRLMALLILLALISASMARPQRAYAQWPPFSFRLTPVYEDAQITYQLRLSSQVAWRLADITVKVPLPEGTRFLKADALATTEVAFDGAEVTFFTAHNNIRDAYFVVEVTDPNRTVFTAHAWVAWQGDYPGDYLTEDEAIDITQKPLIWEKPPSPRVQLETEARVVADIITYNIYPTSVTGKRIWDLEVRAPIPPGTTFLSAEAPPSFVTGFDGQEVSFTTLELPSRTEVGPLSFKVSTAGVTASTVETNAWAVWKTRGQDTRPQNTNTGKIIVVPGAPQQVVADMTGDVPFANYDLTSLALQNDGFDLKVTFYTAGDLGPVGEPLEYILYIDRDCQAETGKLQKGHGLEYRLRYRHSKDKAELNVWEETGVASLEEVAEEDEGETEADVVEADAAEAEGEEAEVVVLEPAPGGEVKQEGSWSNLADIQVSSPAGSQTVTLWVPYHLLDQNGLAGGDQTDVDLGQQFCWWAEAKNKTKTFSSNPPTERLPGSLDPRLTQYSW